MHLISLASAMRCVKTHSVVFKWKYNRIQVVCADLALLVRLWPAAHFPTPVAIAPHRTAGVWFSGLLSICLLSALCDRTAIRRIQQGADKPHYFNPPSECLHISNYSRKLRRKNNQLLFNIFFFAHKQV